MSARKKFFTTQNLVAVVTGLLLFSLAPQQPIHERFSLLERSALALFTLIIILYVRNREIRQWILPIPLILLLIVMGISMAQMPAFFIIRDFLAFVLITLYAVVAVSHAGSRPVVWGAALAAIFLLLVTTIYALLIPETAFLPYGPLKGAFYGENSLGISLMFFLPAIASATLSSRIWTYIFRSAIAIWAFAVIYLSTSKTSLLVFFIFITAWILFRIFQRSPRVASLIASIILICLITLSLNWNNFTGFLGKTADLSGRFPLWEAYSQAILEKPLAGYGWHIRTTTDMPLGNYILNATGFPQINANNDLLNWWALTGFFGALLALVCVVLVLLNGVRDRNNYPDALWVFLIGVLLLAGGATELSTMHPDGWAILSLAFVASGTALSVVSSNKRSTLSRGILLLK